MKVLQTAERVSDLDISDNFVYQRSVLAYVEAAKLVSGRVMEIGTGMGYGLKHIAPKCEKFVTIDKHQELENFDEYENVEFLQMNVPPFNGIEDNSFDFVITFQVIEHIEDDNKFVEEIYRVLKPGGKLIVTTPNIKMSLTRNPWHVREYTVTELKDCLLKSFQAVTANGVFGNDKIMEYYAENKRSVERITRFDIFDFQHKLPRRLLQIPYDILNRWNRKKILEGNQKMVSDIKMDDYFVKTADDACFDLMYIAEKK
ncbi:MAG: class I SAM-dependent methyltransferase [Flavobacteriales bacterium]